MMYYFTPKEWQKFEFVFETVLMNQDIVKIESETEVNLFELLDHREYTVAEHYHVSNTDYQFKAIHKTLQKTVDFQYHNDNQNEWCKIKIS